jgi:N-hydroxyarylamine O-acetyltransferase
MIARAVLFDIHRAHLTAITYENLDIHLGRAVGLDLEAIYDKLVNRGRGGWCYEMNTLLAWALRACGFDVTVIGAAVGPEHRNEWDVRDHMALVVRCDGEWLADAGFGNAFLDPLPLRAGDHTQGRHVFRLTLEPDGYWRFHNHTLGGPGFVFRTDARAQADFAQRCDWLQRAPESGFVKLTVCHRLRADHAVLTLRGAVLTVTDAAGRLRRTVTTREDYGVMLRNVFALRLDDAGIDTLWARVWPAHLAWEATRSAE